MRPPWLENAAACEGVHSVAALARASFPELTRLPRMIGVSSSSRSFKSLGHYLVVGRGGDEPNRVAWSTARNLPTNDPQLAAKIMRATAAQNVRVDQPVYHLALSFDPRDIVDRQQMERVADRVLTELGLRDYQSLIVAHRDRQHSHLHILINRVHPVSHKAWDRWQDYSIVQRVLRDEERALGLHQLDVGAGKERGNTITADEARGAPSTRAEYFAQRRSISQMRDDLIAYESKTEQNRLRYSAELSVASSEARAMQLEDALRRVQRLDGAFSAALGSIYRDAEVTKATFLAIVQAQGADATLKRLRESPETVGALRMEFVDSRGGMQSMREQQVEAACSRGAELLTARRDLITLLEREVGSRVVGIDQSTIDAAKAATLDRVAGARNEHRALRDTRAGEQTLAQLEFRLSQAVRRLAPPEFAKLCLTLSGTRLSLAHKLRGVVRDVVLGRDEGR